MKIQGPVTSMHSPPVVEVGGEELAALKRAAAAAPLRRARISLHSSSDSMVQEMIIAFGRDSYIRPHRHLDKQESFHLFEGALSVGLFDDAGELERWIHLSEGGNRFYRLNASRWHTVVIRSEFAVIQEVTNGPFIAGGDHFAPWSTPADDIAAGDVLADWRGRAEEDEHSRA